uniref:J domain-containing protein n=1 Tax=Kalanchoe fedtschenkoi TaxID=63787 RepID=A0A7N0UT04_KALFE
MSGRAPTKSYYEILGMSKAASDAELERAYMAAAMNNDPDRGGDREQFEELARAYEVLRDPIKRGNYDKYGEVAGSGSGAEMQNKVAEMQNKVAESIHPIMLLLDDFYKGTTKKVSYRRNVICSKCSGEGSISKSVVCTSCCKDISKKEKFGRSTNRPCRACSIGIIQCDQCKGTKVVKERKLLQVTIERGIKNFHRIIFPSKGDEEPGMITGDLIIVVEETRNSKFMRKGDDLFYDHTLTLGESLCGYKFIVTHMDGRKLLIESGAREIVKPDSYRKIKKEGMPLHRSPGKGNLFIKFTVKYPNLTSYQRGILLAVLQTEKNSSEAAVDESGASRPAVFAMTSDEELKLKLSLMNII